MRAVQIYTIRIRRAKTLLRAGHIQAASNELFQAASIMEKFGHPEAENILAIAAQLEPFLNTQTSGGAK